MMGFCSSFSHCCSCLSSHFLVSTSHLQPKLPPRDLPIITINRSSLALPTATIKIKSSPSHYPPFLVVFSPLFGQPLARLCQAPPPSPSHHCWGLYVMGTIGSNNHVCVLLALFSCPRLCPCPELPNPFVTWAS